VGRGLRDEPGQFLHLTDAETEAWGNEQTCHFPSFEEAEADIISTYNP
jgi:hypothetical protein